MSMLLLINIIFLTLFGNSVIEFNEVKTISKAEKSNLEKLIKYNDSLYDIQTFVFISNDSINYNDLSYIRIGNPKLDSSLIFIVNDKKIINVINGTHLYFLIDDSIKKSYDTLSLKDQISSIFSLIKTQNYFQQSGEAANKFGRIAFVTLIIFIVFVLLIHYLINVLFSELRRRKYYKSLTKEDFKTIDEYYLFNIEKKYAFNNEMLKIRSLLFLSAFDRLFRHFEVSHKYIIEDSLLKIRQYIKIEKALLMYHEIHEEYQKKIDIFECYYRLNQSEKNRELLSVFKAYLDSLDYEFRRLKNIESFPFQGRGYDYTYELSSYNATINNLRNCAERAKDILNGKKL